MAKRGAQLDEDVEQGGKVPRVSEGMDDRPPRAGTGEGGHRMMGDEVGRRSPCMAAGTGTMTFINKEVVLTGPSAFAKMWKQMEFVDISFEDTARDKKVYAHRLVLAMQSKKLRELIKNIQKSIFAQPDVSSSMSRVDISSVHFDALSVILDYIYEGKCTISSKGDTARTVLELCYSWGMEAIKEGLEAQGVVHLTTESCARCLAAAYNKGPAEDWEARGQRELVLVLENFQTIDELDLLLFPEPVMAKLLASDDLAVTSEKFALDRLYFWMKHKLEIPESDKSDSTTSEAGAGAEGGCHPLGGAGEGGRAEESNNDSVSENGGNAGVVGSSKSGNVCADNSRTSGSGGRQAARKVVPLSPLRGRDLLKHIRWPEFQREMLSEMFVNPDPSIGEHIQTMVIESLAWANFSLDARRMRCLESDTARHPKYLPRHSVFPRQVPLPMTPLQGYKDSLKVREKGHQIQAVGEGGGVAVFGHSTNCAVHHYILEWTGPENSAQLDDGYMGIVCATTLSLEKSGCFVLCGLGGKLGEGGAGLGAQRASDDTQYTPGQSVQLTVDALNKELSLWTTDEEGKAGVCLNTKQCQGISTPWIPCVAVFRQGSSFTWRIADA